MTGLPRNGEMVKIWPTPGRKVPDGKGGFMKPSREKTVKWTPSLLARLRDGDIMLHAPPDEEKCAAMDEQRKASADDRTREDDLRAKARELGAGDRKKAAEALEQLRAGAFEMVEKPAPATLKPGDPLKTSRPVGALADDGGAPVVGRLGDDISK